jgi:2-polyprenyl-6-methoxyphenol hydroxylase-like FAD-dependent oxidoreductase
LDSPHPASAAFQLTVAIQGLSLALALSKVSIPCTVYEARSESYDIGGGITLSPNALRILDKLGVYQRVTDRGFHFDQLAFSDGDGNVNDVYYFGSKELYGYRAFRIIRRLLIQELQTMLKEQDIPIHFNKPFTRVVSETADDVEIEFADGSTVHATILIGADGIHSSVRRYVFPDVDPVYSGFTAINCVCPRSRLRIPRGFHLPATVMAKPGAFLMVPQEVDGSQLLIGAQRRFPEKDKEGWDQLAADKQGLLDMIRENKEDWPDIVQSALEGAPVENMGIWAFYGIPPLKKWASWKDRVIIVGDAAHAIPPTAGQGVNQAFEDINMLAILLSRLSSKVTLSDALAFWQKYRQERVDKILELTKQMNAKRLPPAEQAKLPPGAIWSDESATRGDGGQLRWLYEPDLDHDVEEWLASKRV